MFGANYFGQVYPGQAAPLYIAGGSVSLAVASSTETSAAEALTERVSLAVGVSTEDASAATLSERSTLAVGVSSEALSGATLAERLSVAATGATEDASGVTLAEWLAVAVASSSEASSGSTASERVTFANATAGETASDATIVIPPPATSLAVASAAEMGSDVIVVVPSVEAPPPLAVRPGTFTVSSHVQFSVASTTEASSDVALVTRPRLRVAVASSTVTIGAVEAAIRVADAPPIVQPRARVSLAIAGAGECRSEVVAPLRLGVAVVSGGETAADVDFLVIERAYERAIPALGLTISSAGESGADVSCGVVSSFVIEPEPDAWDPDEGGAIFAAFELLVGA